MPSPWRAACVLSHAAMLLGWASAGKLAFDTPNLPAQPTASNGLPYFVVDNFVTISWWTLFDNTTLKVVQDLGNGTILWELLAINWRKSQTETLWTAGGIGGHSIQNSKFYFLLQNGLDGSCAACNLSSSYFALKSKAFATTSSPTSSIQTSTFASNPSAHTQTTAQTTTTTSPGSVESSAIVSHSARPKTAGNLTLQLAVGLGAGIPAFLGLVFILCLGCRHRRRKRRLRNEDRTLSSEGLAPGGENAQMRERGSHLSRESGALGPYAQNLSPTWEQQEAREQAEREQQQQLLYQQQQQPTLERQQRGSSTRHIPFRPSLGAHSEVSDESSRHSWIDDFDFERPGPRDVDESSQTTPRRSSHEAPSSNRSYHTPSAPSQSSIVDVADVPEIPQPVHYGYGYPVQNFSRR